MNRAGKMIKKNMKRKGTTLKFLGDLTSTSKSTVQRIVKGESFPTERDIKLIAEFLEIDYDVLNKAFEDDWLERERAKQLSQNLISHEEIIVPLSFIVDFSRDSRLKLQELRAKNSQEALQKIEQLKSALVYAIKRPTTEIVKHAVLSELSYVSLETANLNSDQATSYNQAVTKNIIFLDEQQNIANEVESFETEAIVSMTRAGIYQIGNDFKRVLEFRDLPSYLSDPYWELAFRRLIGSCAAFIGHEGKREAFNQVYKIYELIEKGSLDYNIFSIIWARNTIARIFVEFKQEKTLDFFEDTWKIYHSITQAKGRSGLREVQLTRDHLLAVAKLDPTNSSLIQELKQRADEAIEFDKDYDTIHLRYVEQMQLLFQLLEGTKDDLSEINFYRNS